MRTRKSPPLYLPGTTETIALAKGKLDTEINLTARLKATPGKGLLQARLPNFYPGAFPLASGFAQHDEGLGTINLGKINT